MLGLLSGMKQAVVDVASKIVADDQDEETPPCQVEAAHVEFADGLTFETFSAFPTDKLDDSWIMVPAQEAHAKTILELSENLRSVRFKLCPSVLKDEDFWQIYFIIVQGDSAALGESDESWAMLCAEGETVLGSDAVLLPDAEKDSYSYEEDLDRKGDQPGGHAMGRPARRCMCRWKTCCCAKHKAQRKQNTKLNADSDALACIVAKTEQVWLGTPSRARVWVQEEK
eukprot:CAMPEP_0196735594 /NCGR_PEP_ID=MMETSP1091-20130531/13980_1 /TAXON_ID=302021 /ORGANISM="Rhodomonas sp., Strain CCMP768" /LENGTH=226 /DNA_ID=CAMNT_0042079247 /DNA_START=77 /DNA_END=758 /DNA_ORIENTATION=-